MEKNNYGPPTCWRFSENLHQHFILTSLLIRCQNLCSLYTVQIRQIYWDIFLGVLMQWIILFQKSPKMPVFGLSLFRTWKIKKRLNVGHIWNMIWQALSFPSIKNLTIIHVWVSCQSIFRHIVWSFIWVAKSKNGVYFSPSHFLMFSKKIFSLELHRHIPEIHPEILVYGKGVSIKHIRTLAIVKIEFSDLWQINHLTMRKVRSGLFTHSI